MASTHAGSASLPGTYRPEDRLVVGAHTWIILGGTTNRVGERGEADAAVPVAEALARSPGPPGLEAILSAFGEIDRAIEAWSDAAVPDDDLWSWYLGAVVLVIDGSVARIAHVGAPRASVLSWGTAVGSIHASPLTHDHTIAGELRQRGEVWAPGRPNMVLSSFGQRPLRRIDTTTVPVLEPTRFVLTSEGAHAGLETPLGYLAGVDSPDECAERICAEARSRGSTHHGSAIVVDVEPPMPPRAPYR